MEGDDQHGMTSNAGFETSNSAERGIDVTGTKSTSSTPSRTCPHRLGDWDGKKFGLGVSIG